MTVRTLATLKANWIETEPDVRYGDALDTLVDHGTGDHLWVNPEGSDTIGIGSYANPYATITTAFAAVTAANPNVIVMPGTYTEDVTWPAISGVRLIGLGKQGAVTISSGTAGLTVYPATSLASFAGYIDNVNFTNTTGTGLYLDNSSCAGTFALHLRDVKFTHTAGTSLFTNHGTNNPIVIHTRNVDFGGPVYLQVRDQNDAFYSYGGKLTGGMVTSGSVSLGGTAEITLAYTEIKHEGVSGGSANQKINSLFCWSRTAKTLALADTSDLAGHHTENIVGS